MKFETDLAADSFTALLYPRGKRKKERGSSERKIFREKPISTKIDDLEKTPKSHTAQLQDGFSGNRMYPIEYIYGHGKI